MAPQPWLSPPKADCFQINLQNLLNIRFYKRISEKKKQPKIKRKTKATSFFWAPFTIYSTAPNQSLAPTSSSHFKPSSPNPILNNCLAHPPTKYMHIWLGFYLLKTPLSILILWWSLRVSGEGVGCLAKVSNFFSILK